MNSRYILIISLVFIAAMTRLVEHPLNFTPLAAMGLFAGTWFRHSWLAYVTPLAAMLISDYFLGFHALIPVVYLCIACSTWIGSKMNQISVLNIGLASVAGSVIFFVVTNFAMWLMQMTEPQPFYPMTFAGLTECYVLAIPFFKNSLAGDLFYNAALFGSWFLAQKAFPSLQKAA